MFDWGSLSEIIVAFTTVFIAIMTLWFNLNLKKLQQYQAKQNDRKIIEDIFQSQKEAQRFLNKPKEFCSDESYKTLIRTRDLANLYGLRHIELHLEKVLSNYLKAVELYYENHNDDGTQVTNFSREKHKQYAKQAQLVREYISDFSCYKNLLKLETNDL